MWGLKLVSEFSPNYRPEHIISEQFLNFHDAHNHFIRLLTNNPQNPRVTNFDRGFFYGSILYSYQITFPDRPTVNMKALIYRV